MVECNIHFYFGICINLIPLSTAFSDPYRISDFEDLVLFLGITNQKDIVFNRYKNNIKS